MSRRRRGAVGVLLAGGRGRRMGGDKASTELAGRPLARWAVEPLAAVCDHVVVACRLDSELPVLPGVTEAWVEPDGPRGAVGGIASALHEARGRPILVVGVCHPLVRPEVLEALLSADPRERPAVAPRAGRNLVPLVARYEPAALAVLAGMPPAIDPEAAVGALRPAEVAFDGGESSFLRIDAPEDLLRAGAVLDARRRAGAAA